jgi:hypothetical protein
MVYSSSETSRGTPRETSRDLGSPRIDRKVVDSAPGAAHLQGYGVSSTAQGKHALRAGMAVRIVGLENATYLNGKQGVLRNWDSTLGRWVVRLTSGEEKGIRAVNVTPIQGPGGNSGFNSGYGTDNGSDQANKELEGLLLQTNWSAIYQLFYQRFGIAVLDKLDRGQMVKGAVEMSLSIVAKCFALLRSDPGGRLHCTPLHIAALQSSTEAAEVIVRDLPKLVEQTHKPSHSALCPLHIAILTGSQAIVDLLLEGRADPNVRTLHDICPIHLAATTSKDLCQALLSYNAEPLRRDVMGSTAVHYAASFKQQAVVELLCQLPSSQKLVTEGDQKRITPLHISCALYSNEDDIVIPMSLLAHGAKPWQADVSGAAARDVVPWSQHSALMSFFEAHGDRAQSAAQQWMEQWRAAKEDGHVDNQDDNRAEGELPEENTAEFATAASEQHPVAGRVSPSRQVSQGSKDRVVGEAKEEAMRKEQKEYAAELERIKQELSQSNKERTRLEQSLANHQQSAEAMQAVAEKTLSQYKSQLESVQKKQVEERAEAEVRLRSLVESAREEGRADGLKIAQEGAAKQLEDQQRHFNAKRDELEFQLQEARTVSMKRLDPDQEDEGDMVAFARRDELGATLSGFGNKLAGFGSNLRPGDAMEAKQEVEELALEVQRLQELHGQEQADRYQDIKNLQEQLHQAQEEAAAFKGRRAETEAELERLRAEGSSKLSEVKILQDQVRQLQDQARQLQDEASGLRARRAEADDRCQQLVLEHQEADSRAKKRDIECEKKIADLELREAQALANGRSEAEAALSRAEAAEALIQSLNAEIRNLQEQFAEEQMLRKRLHNQIQDMKGAIRVFCRFRPMVQRERDGGDTVAARRVDAFTAEVIDPKRRHNTDDKGFQFDAVFDSDTSQETVFADCRELVQSAVDGYNVTIFAYGQTGAGKTWTMYGNEQNPGLAPRSIDSLFRVIRKEEQKGSKTFKVKAYMIELYKQEIIDLLSRAEKPSNHRGLEVKRDLGRGMMFVEGVTEREVQTPEDLHQTLAEGERRRHVTATKMNSSSSRSHLLMSIIIQCKVKEPEQLLYGKITLCDLAGSERPKKSEVTGDALKEAIEINKSLSALGDVIESLTKGAKSVPYRNHKLTMLMQDSIGGTAKTLMFVNCSPASSNSEESTMSLKWASRARQITNDVKRNADSKEVARLKQVIAMMSQAQNASEDQAQQKDQSDDAVPTSLDMVS